MTTPTLISRWRELLRRRGSGLHDRINEEGHEAGGEHVHVGVDPLSPAQRSSPIDRWNVWKI